MPLGILALVVMANAPGPRGSDARAVPATDQAAEPADDWPCWRGALFDGVSPATGLRKKWPADGPPILWRVELSGGYSSVAVAKGRLFTHTAKDKKEEFVLCLEAATGRELWRYTYPCDYDQLVTLQEGNDSGPRATPAVDGTLVYTIGTSGIVLCLEAATGKKVWERRLVDIAGRQCPPLGYCSSPLIWGDHLYVHPGGSKGNSIAALNKKDGRLVWQTLNDEPSFATPVPAAVHGTTQIVFFTSEAVVGVTPNDGKVLWRQPWLTPGGGQGATPIAVDGQLFISSNFGTGAARWRLRPEGNPETVWKNRVMQNHYATSVLYQGNLYGFSGLRLRCVDWATGAQRWDKGGLGRGTLLAVDGQLIILTEDGYLILAEATPKAYVETSRCQLFPDRPSCTVPVLAGGRLFLRNERLLLALDLKESQAGRR
jgi:hypothetical protein